MNTRRDSRRVAKNSYSKANAGHTARKLRVRPRSRLSTDSGLAGRLGNGGTNSVIKRCAVVILVLLRLAGGATSGRARAYPSRPLGGRVAGKSKRETPRAAAAVSRDPPARRAPV